MQVDDGLGQLGQLLIRRSFFIEGLLKECGAFLLAQKVGLSARTAVTGDLVVLNSLRRGKAGANRSDSDPKPVLLLVDVINPLDFPEAAQLLRYLPAMTKRIRRLQDRAREAGVPVTYVNDNFGRWRSDLRAQVEFCLAEDSRGCELVRQLQPEQSVYFVLKPKHSGFFATPLEILLSYLGTRRLIVTGIGGNLCVFFTANNAYMRDYELVVPCDCVASNTLGENRQALALMAKFLKADIRSSRKIKF